MERNRAAVKIMGIINITNDSFYSGSRATTEDEINKRLRLLVDEGADIIDIGACSTKPGLKSIPEEQEWERLKPALKIYNSICPNTPLSIDTFRSSVVERAYDLLGDFIVNDISAGEDDRNMLSIVGKLGLKYIAMHKRGTPETMQSFCEYNDIVEDIIDYFKEFEHKAADAGISSWILDPGFGFSKTIEQNYEMLNRLSEFKALGRPILVGISRKSFIYKKLGITPEEALDATTSLHKLAIQNGADILRVHDVGIIKYNLSL